MSRFDDLKATIRPPRIPLDPHGDWRSVERDIGISLPADYKQFITAYGTGTILDRGFNADEDRGTLCDLGVLNPFAQVRHRNLKHRIASTKKWVARLHRSFPDEYPYPPWPEPRGLFCWGTNGNGDSFYWLTKGGPDEWRIVIDHHSSARMVTFETVGVVDFLVAFLRNKLPDSPIGRFEVPVFEPDPKPEPE